MCLQFSLWFHFRSFSRARVCVLCCAELSCVPLKTATTTTTAVAEQNTISAIPWKAHKGWRGWWQSSNFVCSQTRGIRLCTKRRVHTGSQTGSGSGDDWAVWCEIQRGWARTMAARPCTHALMNSIIALAMENILYLLLSPLRCQSASQPNATLACRALCTFPHCHCRRLCVCTKRVAAITIKWTRARLPSSLARAARFHCLFHHTNFFFHSFALVFLFPFCSVVRWWLSAALSLYHKYMRRNLVLSETAARHSTHRLNGRTKETQN